MEPTRGRRAKEGTDTLDAPGCGARRERPGAASRGLRAVRRIVQLSVNRRVLGWRGAGRSQGGPGAPPGWPAASRIPTEDRRLAMENTMAPARRRRYRRQRKTGSTAGGVAAGAAAGGLLRRGLSGPRQRGLRQAADAAGTAIQRDGVRAGRRDLLHRLLPVRDSQQHHPAQGRGARLDRAHHDHLGPHFLVHDVREQRAHVLCAALPAGRGRGGLLPRHHPVPDLLVSGPSGAGASPPSS